MRKMQVGLCLSRKQKAELQEFTREQKNDRTASQASSLLNVHNTECVKAMKTTQTPDSGSSLVKPYHHQSERKMGE